MLQPGRTAEIGQYTNSFGFNGMEKDDEIKGRGNSINFTFRIHDPRIGRFLSIDPLASKYPFYSPYQFSGNRVIDMIELEGLEATLAKYKNVYFVELKNADATFIKRMVNKSFTETAKKYNTPLDDYSVNLQLYEPTNKKAESNYFWGASSPQPLTDYRAIGLIRQSGNTIAGRSSPQMFYFAYNSSTKTWYSGNGDVPEGSTGFGGGIPVYVNGLKYGEKNIYSSDAPEGLPEIGDPGEKNRKYLLQRSNAGWKAQVGKDVGKTVIGYNSLQKTWNIVVQKDGVEGMTLYEIRDKLISQGYDNILSFDGSTSSSLIHGPNILVNPSERKDNTIPTGIRFSVPWEKKE